MFKVISCDSHVIMPNLEHVNSSGRISGATRESEWALMGWNCRRRRTTESAGTSNSRNDVIASAKGLSLSSGMTNEDDITRGKG